MQSAPIETNILYYNSKLAFIISELFIYILFKNLFCIINLDNLVIVINQTKLNPAPFVMTLSSLISPVGYFLLNNGTQYRCPH